MAPMISGINKKKINLKNLNKNLQNEKNKMLQIRKYIENNFENVGTNFSKKVREIYYDKKSKKATLVIITHKTTEVNAKNCLYIFKKNKNILKFPTLIRLYN